MLVGTTNLNTTLNLTYVLTDVVETLLYDLRSEMGKQGYELRHDAKRNYPHRKILEMTRIVFLPSSGYW